MTTEVYFYFVLNQEFSIELNIFLGGGILILFTLSYPF